MSSLHQGGATMIPLKRRGLWGAWLALLAAASFGTYPVFAKFAFQYGFNVSTVLALRFTGSALLLWVWLFYSGRVSGLKFKRLVPLLLLGGVVYSTMSALNLLAVSWISASLASMLLCTYPIFVTSASMLLGIEPVRRDNLLALLVSFTGIVMLLRVDFSQVRSLGILCGLGASFAYTAYILLGNRLIKAVDPLEAVAMIMTGAAIVFCVSGASAGSINLAYPMKGWLTLLGMILCSTVFAVVLFWHSIRMIGPAKASIIGTAEPLVSVLLSVMIFSERLAARQTIGSILIILGVVYIQSAGMRQVER